MLINKIKNIILMTSRNTLWNAIEGRRSIYAIDNKISQSTQEIKDLIDFAVKHIPSAFNNQSTRTVLLVGEQHWKLWDATKEILKAIVSAENFAATEQKIDNCFRSGYGTVLYFIDEEVNKKWQGLFPSYASNFPTWAEQSSGMHQLAIWTMLSDLGLGASLQHYNPLIDEFVAKEWNINSSWRLVAQMPFGRPVSEPGQKEFQPLVERSLLFE